VDIKNETGQRRDLRSAAPNDQPVVLLLRFQSVTKE